MPAKPPPERATHDHDLRKLDFPVGTKLSVPAIDTKTVAADAVRAAAKALNKAMEAARQADVITDVSLEKVMPSGVKVRVICNTRV